MKTVLWKRNLQLVLKVARIKLVAREYREIWDFLRIQNRNWTQKKKKIPKNSLFYINQSYISTVKNGNLAMYHHNFIIGQLIVAANQSN